jgi:thiamine biosynthesis lipoprotein
MRLTMPLFHFGFSAMASVNELQIWADAETDARRGADTAIADVQRIEAKYSRYRDDSVVARINREAGRAETPIDPETAAALLRYADQCYRLSGTCSTSRPARCAALGTFGGRLPGFPLVPNWRPPYRQSVGVMSNGASIRFVCHALEWK